MTEQAAAQIWQPDAIACFGGAAAAARRLATQFNVPCHLLDLHTFPDGECRVRADVTFKRPALYQSLDHPNAKIMPLVLGAAAMRDRGAGAVMLIAPYLAYMRQDRAFNPGEAVSQRVFGDLLAAHFDVLVTVDPHLHRTPTLGDVFKKKPALALSAASAFADYATQSDVAKNTLIVGPDQESQMLVRAIAQRLGFDGLIARKVRHPNRIEIALPGNPDLGKRPVIVVDDVLTSADTIAALTVELKKRGAGAVDVYVTHALCDEAAAKALRTSGVRALIATDTVAHSSSRVAIAKVIADGISAAAGKR